MEEIWEYVEPHSSGGTCYVRMTKQQAIDWMKTYILKYYSELVPNTDEEIFQEWVVVNWAYKYEEKTK